MGDDHRLQAASAHSITGRATARNARFAELLAVITGSTARSARRAELFAFNAEYPATTVQEPQRFTVTQGSYSDITLEHREPAGLTTADSAAPVPTDGRTR